MTNEIAGTPPTLEEANIDELDIVATPAGGGWWDISAPWLEAPEKVQGEQNAKLRVAELVAQGAPAEDPEDEGGHHAPMPDNQIPSSVPREFRGTLDKKQKQALGMPKTTRIILEENDEIPPSGLYLGVNGRGYMIQPGVEVDVPDFLLEVLDHAEESAPVIDPQTRRVVGWRKRLRYSYRTVGK